MPVLTPAQAGGQNRCSFLDMIAVSEGTSTSPFTKNDGYDVIVEGVHGVHDIFTDYSHHPFQGIPPAKDRPSIVVNDHGLTSNASGRYQIMLKWWKRYGPILHLPDFSPYSQDRYALNQLKEQGALPLIDAGKIQEAILKVNDIWASLAGSQYGQYTNKMDVLIAAYKAHGGSAA